MSAAGTWKANIFELALAADQVLVKDGDKRYHSHRTVCTASYVRLWYWATTQVSTGRRSEERYVSFPPDARAFINRHGVALFNDWDGGYVELSFHMCRPIRRADL